MHDLSIGPAPAAHDEPAALETRAAAPARTPRTTPPAPAIRTQAAPSSVEEIRARIDEGNRTLDDLSRRISSQELRRSISERKARAVALLREEAPSRRAAARAAADPVRVEKVARVNAEIDATRDAEIAALRSQVRELTVRAARPHGPTGPQSQTRSGTARALYRAGVLHWMRTGEESFRGQSLRDMQRRAVHGETDGAGGYMLVPERDTGPFERLLSVSTPMRQLATVRSVSASVLEKPFNLGGATGGWVGESASRPETATSQLAMLRFPVMELYAMPGATNAMLDDAMIDIEAWLAEEVNITFSEMESAAYVSGDGVNKPKGVLAYDTVADDAWSWGKLGFIKTGANGAFHATQPGDALNELPYKLKAGYRARGAYLMNRSTLASVRSMKDSNGGYIWQPGLQQGQPDRLCGHLVVEAEDMPTAAANSLSVAFGDFQSGYLIVDRLGVRVVRDPYTSKPHVLFYTTKRVGGGVQNFEAIKLLKFSA